MGDVRKTIVLATGQEPINREIAKRGEFEVTGTVDKREDLEQVIRATNPSIVLVGEGLPGYGFLPSILLEIAGRSPYTRFVYLAGEISPDDEKRIEPIVMLARAGIYDIVHSGQIKKKDLLLLLNEPRTEKDVSYLFDEPALPEGIFINEPDDEVEVEYSSTPTSLQALAQLEPIDEEVPMKDKKVIVFSSIKPGTGKSFLAVNVATAIAQFGINRENGKRPRVALIEADLQNLSIGTLLQIEDHDSHLMKAMKIIEKLMNSSGALTATNDELQDANMDLLKCMTPYHRVKNLEVLAGSQTLYNEVHEISSNYYSYLIEALRPHYDYIVIDSNSSMAHTTTYPILEASDACFYIINLDFNNIRNNMRYQQDLEKWKVMDKVHYILNEDYTPTKEGERLEFGKRELEELKFNLEASIPSIEKSIFHNRIFQGTPLILDSDKNTHDARQQILKVANSIHTIMNFSENSGDELLKKKKIGFRR